MRKSQFIFVLMLTTILGTANVYAEDSYQNCYGAVNCLTLADFAKQKIREHITKDMAEQDAFMDQDEYSNYLHSIESEIKTSTNSFKGNSDIYVSISDDGNAVTIHAPTGGSGIDLPEMTYTNSSADHENILGGYKNITVTGNVKSIPSEFLYDQASEMYDQPSPFASLEKVTLPDSITSIGSSAFTNTGLKEFIVPAGVTSIGDGAFAGSGITELVIPDSVTSIGGYAFQNSEIKELVIPDSVTSIGPDAFLGMHNLEKLVLPSAEFQGQFFGDLENLKEITIPDTLPLHYISIGASDSIPLDSIDEAYANGEISLDLYTQAKDYRDDLLSEWWCIEEGDDCLDGEYYEVPYDIISSVFGNLDMSKIKINCIGDLEKCKANMAQAGYEEDSYNMLQVKPKSTNTEVKNADGSTTIYDKDGNFVGYKGKRIYTTEEANAVAGKTNHVKIRYR